MSTLSPDSDFAKRADAAYHCPAGHTFTLTFAAGVTQPATWDCRHCGQLAQLAGGKLLAPPADPVRSHWDMVRERRSLDDLASLLNQYTDAEPVNHRDS